MSLEIKIEKKKVSKMKMTTIVGLITLVLALAGCHTTTHPVSKSNVSAKPYTESDALTIYEAHPLKGSEKVSVHAYSYTRGSDHCSRTIALNFSSSLAYTQTMIALRNRAMVTGANALSITNGASMLELPHSQGISLTVIPKRASSQ